MKTPKLTALLALLAFPAAAQVERVRAGSLADPASCQTGRDRVVLALGASAQTACDGTTGAETALCCCLTGAWQPCPADLSSVLTGVTNPPLGGLEVTGSTVGVRSDCANGQILRYITIAPGWICTDDIVGPSPGDQGDITVSGIDGTWSIDSNAVTDAKASNNLTIESAATIKTAGRLHLGSLTDGSAAALTRDSSDKIFHDSDADGNLDAGEVVLADAGGSMFVSPVEMVATSGSATLSSTSISPFLVLTDGVTTEVAGVVSIPPSLAGRTFQITIVHSPSTSISCNYRVAIERSSFGSGFVPSNSGTTTTSTIASSGSTASAIVSSVLASQATSSSDVGIRVAVRRHGSDGLDSCSNSLYLYLVRLEVT